MTKVLIYSYYNRFWHWAQALLILFLALTGFEVHGSYTLFGYENAVTYHANAAWSLIILIVFTVFWDFTIGEWRQYIPTLTLMKEQVNYYITGIFNKAPHPTHKTRYNKFNPLQRVTYLGLKILIIPVVITSGLFYYFFLSQYTAQAGLNLAWIAYTHTFGAFILIGFLIVHVYLTTTGHTVMSSLKAMITGWEEVSEDNLKHAIAEGLQVKIDQIQSQISSGQKQEMLTAALKDMKGNLGFPAESRREKSPDASDNGEI